MTVSSVRSGVTFVPKTNQMGLQLEDNEAQMPAEPSILEAVLEHTLSDDDDWENLRNQNLGECYLCKDDLENKEKDELIKLPCICTGNWKTKCGKTCTTDPDTQPRLMCKGCVVSQFENHKFTKCGVCGYDLAEGPYVPP